MIVAIVDVAGHAHSYLNVRILPQPALANA